MNELNTLWDKLLDIGISSQTLTIVTCINGYSKETLEAILYAETGYRSFDQYEDEQGE